VEGANLDTAVSGEAINMGKAPRISKMSPWA